MLEKKHFLVAGACGLLGRPLVSGLLENGARVVAVDRNKSALQALRDNHAASDALHVLDADISSAEHIQQAFQAAETRFGRLDGAVNCTYPRGRNYGRHVLDIEYADFTDSVSQHLGAYFLLMQQCARYAKDSGEAFSLVNFSSIYGSMAPRFEVYEGTPMTMPAEYAAIKSGIQHLTRYFAAYMKGTRFRANCVSPGGVFDHQPEAFLDRYKAHCNHKGMLDPQDLVGSVLFLLSPAADYINGQVLTVDDGFSL